MIVQNGFGCIGEHTEVIGVSRFKWGLGMFALRFTITITGVSFLAINCHAVRILPDGFTDVLALAAFATLSRPARYGLSPVRGRYFFLSLCLRLSVFLSVCLSLSLSVSLFLSLGF